VGDYVTLLGAEKIQNAGHEISSAAESMRRSVGYLSDILDRQRDLLEESMTSQQVFMTEWLDRLEKILAERTV